VVADDVAPASGWPAWPARPQAGRIASNAAALAIDTVVVMRGMFMAASGSRRTL
jgi:hypothetical protein